MSNKEYRPTLAQLRTFVTIAECKHFGTAATKLSISQPSLSQALVALDSSRAEEFEQFALILQRAFQEAVALAASTGITLKQNVAVAQ